VRESWPFFCWYLALAGAEGAVFGHGTKTANRIPGALHHVINRGNDRRDRFERDGACDAFLGALFEAADKFSWRVHA
jgi:hypothetical protein